VCTRGCQVKDTHRDCRVEGDIRGTSCVPSSNMRGVYMLMDGWTARRIDRQIDGQPHRMIEKEFKHVNPTEHLLTIMTVSRLKNPRSKNPRWRNSGAPPSQGSAHPSEARVALSRAPKLHCSPCSKAGPRLPTLAGLGSDALRTEAQRRPLRGGRHQPRAGHQRSLFSTPGAPKRDTTDSSRNVARPGPAISGAFLNLRCT